MSEKNHVNSSAARSLEAQAWLAELENLPIDETHFEEPDYPRGSMGWLWREFQRRGPDDSLADLFDASGVDHLTALAQQWFNQSLSEQTVLMLGHEYHFTAKAIGVAWQQVPIEQAAILLWARRKTPPCRVTYVDDESYVEAVLAVKSIETLAPPSNTPLAIDDNELAVLNVLNTRYPRLQLNGQLQGVTLLGKQTIGEAVDRLIEKGLAERPAGKRKGAIITAAGKALLSSMQKT